LKYGRADDGKVRRHDCDDPVGVGYLHSMTAPSWIEGLIGDSVVADSLCPAIEIAKIADGIGDREFFVSWLCWSEVAWGWRVARQAPAVLEVSSLE
jgi:hypothetical protein